MSRVDVERAAYRVEEVRSEMFWSGIVQRPILRKHQAPFVAYIMQLSLGSYDSRMYPFVERINIVRLKKTQEKQERIEIEVTLV